MEGTSYVLHAVKDSTNRYSFDEEIFYNHQKTNGDKEVDAVNNGLNELIFRRTLDPEERPPSECIKKLEATTKNSTTIEHISNSYMEKNLTTQWICVLLYQVVLIVNRP